LPVVTASTCLSAAGIVPLAKSRLPEPSTTGKMNSRYSSIRSFFSSVWSRSVLPQVCTVRPGWCRSFRFSATTSPLIRLELFQLTSSRLLDTTYFGRELSAVAMGLLGSVTFGQ